MCKVLGMIIGILGGTGPAGRALAARLASVGLEVRLGSRQPDRGVETAEAIKAKWPDRSLQLLGAGNEEVCDSDLLVLATPWEGAAPMAASLTDRLAGKVVISMVNALAKVGDELQALVPPTGSIALAVQQAARSSFVAGAFHHLPARLVGDLDAELDADVLVCADSSTAKTAAIDLTDRIPGCRGVDGGSLAAAAAVEAFTAVLVGINVRYRVHSSIRLTGFGAASDSSRATESR